MRKKKLIRDFVPNATLEIIKGGFYFSRGKFYMGKKVYCPICKGKYSRFLDFGERQSVMCPGCSSLERHRFLYLYLKKELKILNSNLEKKILHFAPEYSLQKKLKKIYKNDYISADLEHPNAMIHFDITKIPFKKNSFDYIICNHVLQEVKQDIVAMKEMFRVLRKDGFLITMTPIDEERKKSKEGKGNESESTKTKEYGYYGATRIYGKDFLKKLKNVGFKLEIIDPTKLFSKEKAAYMGLSKEKIYLCKK